MCAHLRYSAQCIVFYIDAVVKQRSVVCRDRYVRALVCVCVCVCVSMCTRFVDVWACMYMCDCVCVCVGVRQGTLFFSTVAFVQLCICFVELKGCRAFKVYI